MSGVTDSSPITYEQWLLVKKLFSLANDQKPDEEKVS